MKPIAVLFFLLQISNAQDDLREKILSDLPDNWVKNSVLQELYIRNLVTVENGIVNTKIPFDLHSYDCGAPDCYTTLVSFNFSLSRNQLPNEIDVEVSEFGCVEDQFIIRSAFYLNELIVNEAMYYSDELMSALIIKKSDSLSEYVYFYTDVKRDFKPIDLDNINFDEDAPYRSAIMRYPDYDIFLK